MKKTILKTILFSVLILGLALGTQSLTTKSAAKPAVFGYSITVGAGLISEQYNCGEDYDIGVLNSTDIIYTGTAVFINFKCITPLPNCIIVSRSGWTAGMAFYVVDGYVAGPAIAC